MTDIEIVIGEILASKDQRAYKRWLKDRFEKKEKCKNDTSDDKKESKPKMTQKFFDFVDEKY